MNGRQRSSPTPSSTRRATVTRKLEALPTPFGGFHRSNPSWGSLPSSGSSLSLADSPPTRAPASFGNRPHRPRRLRAWLIAFGILALVTLTATLHKGRSVPRLQDQQFHPRNSGSASQCNTSLPIPPARRRPDAERILSTCIRHLSMHLQQLPLLKNKLLHMHRRCISYI